jgi:hypothetical protein
MRRVDPGSMHTHCPPGVTHTLSEDGRTLTHTAALPTGTVVSEITWPDLATGAAHLEDARMGFDALARELAEAADGKRAGGSSTPMEIVGDDLTKGLSGMSRSLRTFTVPWGLFFTARSHSAPTWRLPRLWGRLTKDGGFYPMVGGGWLRTSLEVAFRPRGHHPLGA